MKVLTVLGARPQFIKAGSLSREIAGLEDVKEVIVHTGQHYDSNMSDIFFEQMHIPKPDYFLGVGGKTHGVMTGQMIEKLEEIVFKENPDWVLVYGDTNSTLAGAIVASKLHIKLAHIEAGLRSFNMKMPEEVNRILTDRISNLLFCPTETAVNNLLREGFGAFGCKIVNSGDIMYDGALYYKQFAKRPKTDLSGDFALCTVHRAENSDNKERLESIFGALNEIAQNVQVVLPLHPRTKKALDKFGISVGNITVIEPVGYLEMIWLISNSKLVLTDSGGLQKEAFFFNKRCITLRDETEWIELVESGVNILTGADREKILEAFNAKEPDFSKIEGKLYGDGKSAKKIIKNILEY